MSETTKTAQLVGKWTTVWPVLNILGFFSIAMMKEEGEHYYLSLCVFSRVLEIHFVGKRQLKAFE